MGKKIDWKRMYSHLERARQNVEEDKNAEKVRGVGITLGGKPPRIYATFELLERLEQVRDDFSTEGSDEHRRLCLELTDKVSKVADIMKKHGLIPHRCNSDFKGKNNFVKAYGYRHDDYKISAKNKKHS